MIGRGSTRSTVSVGSIPREDSDVYNYALRVAVLSANVAQARAPLSSSTTASATPPPTSSTSTASTLKPTPPPLRHSSSFRPPDRWTKLRFSIGGTGASGKDEGAGVQFPKELIKVLDARMERIARGSDPTYSDPLLRQTIGAFYTKFATPEFQKQTKEDRKTEQLILMFGATASPILVRALPGDEWAGVLDVHVAKFIAIVRDCLLSREVKNVPPELLSRLEAHIAKLNTAPPPSSSHPHDPYSSPAVPSTSQFTLDVAPPPIPGMTTNVQEMPLVRAVGKLFGKTNAELTKDVIAIKRLCSEKSAFTDLKSLINNVASGAKFPARREDFDSDDAFQSWKKQESDELQEMLFEMMKRSPDLLKSGPNDLGPRSIDMNGNHSNRSSVIGLTSPSPNGSIVGGGEEEIVDSHLFVFIPPDPKFYYKRLFEIALDHDYDAMSELPPDEDVSLTILSNVHEELLRDCALRWRVIEPVRASTFLALIAQHYKHQGVPEACVSEALNRLDVAAHNWNYWRWPWQDRQYLFKNLQAIFNTLLPRFFEVFEGILNLPFEEVVELMERVHSNEIFSEDVRDLSTTLDELRSGMKKFIQFAYEEKQSDVDSLDRPNDLWPFLSMLDWISSETKGYNKRFPSPVVGALDVPSIFIGVAAPEFVKHLDASKGSLLAAASQAPEAANDADLLELYRGVIELQKMHNAFCVETPLQIDFSAWFEPYVKRWLLTTDAKTMEWVSRAIHEDKFEPDETDDKHSSSIVDLIDSCKSATDFIAKLEWPNELENARYLTDLSKTIAKAIEQYSYQLESMFLAEMFPPKAGEAANVDVNRPSAWLTKAKLAVQGDKKVEPFTFQPKTLVKLNNIQAARKLLDTMYTTLGADDVAGLLDSQAPIIPEKDNPPRFLFTVKIVLGENLIGPEGNSRQKVDPFLILSDPHGHRVAKTRTLYETNDPRWDETIDVSVKGDLWIRATVYNRNLVDNHDQLACAYIHLNPKEFGDFLARDVWLKLEDNNGQILNSRLLLRISMEGEKDDIRFYFGRAFRSLKRAENDMTRNIVDKMSPFVRNYISTATLQALTRTAFNFEFDIDLDRVRGGFSKATEKMNAYVQQALNTDAAYTIPPVGHEMHSNAIVPQRAELAKKKGRGPLTDKEIEDAIGDLFDYFNETFGTLAGSLSDEAWQLVSSRLWKEILTTIEALIIPPLSDQPTEMRPLSEKEIDIVFKWLGFLVNFFHAEGEGLPLTTLRNTKYQELVQARMYYDWSSDALCEEAVRAMQRTLLAKKNSVLGRSKSVYQQRNLDSIKARKIEKQQAHAETGEIILRILRMHPGNYEFLTQQISTMLRVQAEQAKQDTGHGRAGTLLRRVGDGRGGTTGGGGGGGRGNRLSGQRGRGRGHAAPAVPPLPVIYDR